MQNDACGIKVKFAGLQRLQVKLCSNTEKRYWLAMAVDVEGVGHEIGTLPINARSGTPITHNPLLPPKCHWQRSFLNAFKLPGITKQS